MAIAVQEFIQEETEQKLPLDRASTAQPIAKQHKAVEVTFKTSPLRRFTLDEFQHLIESGFFDEDERIELIDGLVVEMSPINPRHAICVDKIGRLLNHKLFSDAWVRIQAPLTLEGHSSQPQPDIIAAILQPELYEERHVMV